MSLTTKRLYLGLVMMTSLTAGFSAAQQATPEIKRDPEMLPLIYEKGYRCPQCHQVSERLVGPAFREVAERRKKHPWAHSLLASKIWSGGTGEYGSSEMPHMDEVSDQDVHKIVDWILSLQ